MSGSTPTNTLIKFGGCIAVGVMLRPMATWFDLNPKAWHIFSVFIAVILSFIVRPYPMGMMVLIGLLVLVGTDTITLKESLSGFADTTVWLVIAAFLIAGAVLTTGFGRRVALWLVTVLGGTIRGIAYAICGSEFALGSVIPSNTARGGGIHAPIVDSIIRSINKTNAGTGVSQYLTLVGAHANLIAASTFMTGMAANPLVGAAAKDVFNIDFNWGTWLLGAILPSLISFATLPFIIGWIVGTPAAQSQEAQQTAKEELSRLGPMKRSEKIMASVLFGLLLLWATQFLHGLPTTFIAWLGVAVLLITETQSWQQIIDNSEAWETLFWLGGLLTMASMLSTYGFITWFVENSANVTTGFSAMMIVLVLGLIYFYSMYAFSMLSGHIAAMVVPFFSVCLAAGVEPMLAIAIFAYFSCLCGCVTNYSTGPIIIYFGLGYVRAPKWFKVGFIISLVHIFIWLGVGLLWWKILGWY